MRDNFKSSSTGRTVVPFLCAACPIESRNRIEWRQFRLGLAKSFSGLLKFSQSQAKFMLSFSVNV